MPGMSESQILDLVKASLKDLGTLRVQQVAQSQVDYEIVPQWFKKDKVMIDTGTGIQRNIMYQTAQNARMVRIGENDIVNFGDLLAQMSIGWARSTTNWTITDDEVNMNRSSPQKIVDLLKVRRAAAKLDLIELMETQGWSLPTGDSDTLNAKGLPYWIVKNSSAGYNGGAPSGFSATTYAGLNLNTLGAKFKNYTDTYSNAISKLDAIPKMRTMHRKTGFKSPIDLNDYRNGRGARNRLYLNETSVTEMENIGESQNENLGRDVASIDGVSLVFRGHPMRWAQKLDADTTNPIYFVDHSTFYPVVLEGDWMRESEPMRWALAHRRIVTHVDNTFNFLCLDRRRNGVMYKV